MNHLQRFKDKKNKKAVTKEVKKGLKTAQSEEGDAFLLKAVQSRYTPKKTVNQAKINKQIAIKLTKTKAKHSKRTTPGEIIGQPGAQPHFAQVEGVRWNKVLTMQNKVQSKTIEKKILKRSKIR